MSDIPYSVRDKNIRVNAIKGFNFADIDTNEMFKKVDENNVGGTDVLSTQTSTTNKLIMNAGAGFLKVSVGVLEGITTLLTRSLHINVSGVRERGMTIFDSGGTTRVGIGVTEPEEDLEVDGNIQIDGANNPRLKFQRTGGSPHALSEIRAEQDGTNGGDLQIRTKDDGGSVTEKLRINTDGAIGIIGANYGDAGAVLTSNGGTEPVSWKRPYFMKALLVSDIDADTGPQLEGMTETVWSASFGGATGHWSNDEWTCPQTGIYRITTQVEFESTSDNISFALVFLKLNNSTVILRSENYFGDGNTNDTLIRATVNATSILEIDATDKIRMDFGIATEGGSLSDVTLKGSSVGDATFLIIERIL